MRGRIVPPVLAAAAAAAAAFALWPQTPGSPGATVPPVAAASPVPRAAPPAAIGTGQHGLVPLDDSTFAALIAGTSESGRYFDTDNLISNESSYLHVIGGLREIAVSGGAYLGVGPDQNFSYMAVVRPRIAFILDIRRDNLLQHLMFKALFEMAATRIEYLSLLFARTPPADPAEWADDPIDALLDHIDAAPAPGALRMNAVQRRLLDQVLASGVPLSADDLATIARIHRTFATAGPDLRYNSHGRAPRPSYPTYRQLLLSDDSDGRRASFLAREQDYDFLRALQQANLVIPVVGDFAGPHALRRIGEYLERNGLAVSAFYLSNVEFYLWQDRIFDRFAHNVAALPFDDRTVMIRSLFGRVYGHPQSVPGFNSTQLMQTMSSFVTSFESGRYGTYEDLVYRGYIDVR